MAISMGGGGADAPMGDMNTTPLIDVMLVLLIMFIITLPIQTHAVKIDLPVPPENPIDDPIKPDVNKVFIADSGVIMWNGAPVNTTQLADYLERTKDIEPTPELQLEPHPNARYVIVDNVLAVIKRSGVSGLGFVGNERYAREF
ncbi:biopolymer transporter ExbD [Sphingomonas lacunae]|uniref:Biopolymer transporter ExbD n=1 Tax=Sphingomonas lacunae TaxID=2698828 RepID=A0A6M4ATS3_9SPHN|nr:biopolymer transporter ExbD [Sphingomonas lacunae]QJQ32465.1 biopolymer transporter ExbD [Sphingomonas lacunae]